MLSPAVDVRGDRGIVVVGGGCGTDSCGGAALRGDSGVETGVSRCGDCCVGICGIGT